MCVCECVRAYVVYVVCLRMCLCLHSVFSLVQFRVMCLCLHSDAYVLCDVCVLCAIDVHNSVCVCACVRVYMK